MRVTNAWWQHVFPSEEVPPGALGIRLKFAVVRISIERWSLFGVCVNVGLNLQFVTM